MGVCFVGREHVGKPRCRWEDAVSRDIAGLRQIRNCRTAETNRERCTKKIGNAMAQKWAAARYKKTKKKLMLFLLILFIPYIFLLFWFYPTDVHFYFLLYNTYIIYNDRNRNNRIIENKSVHLSHKNKIILFLL